MKGILYFIVCICMLTVAAQAQTLEKVGDKQKGSASYYANKFHGKKTASGEKFNMYAMTAAHPSLPFNSIIKVTNLANGSWVTLRVNDRGPFTKARIVDVSKAAALKLDMIKEGIIEVEIEVMKIGGQEEVAQPVSEASGESPKSEIAEKKTDNAKETESATTKEQVKPKETTKPNEQVANKPKKDEETPSTVKADEKPKSKEKTTAKTSSSTPASTKKEDAKPTVANTSITASLPLTDKFKPVNTYSIWGTPRKAKGFGAQLGSYNDVQNAIDLGKEAVQLGMKDIFIQAGWSDKQIVYRVIYGAEKKEDEARKLITYATSKGFPKAFLRAHF